MQPDVVIVPCEEYTIAACTDALTQVLAPIGGLDWVTPGMKVAIKANLVSHMKPEKAATTHPAMLCSLVQLLRQRGAEVIIGDSPGGLYNSAYVGSVYRATGLHETEKYGARLNENYGQAVAENPNGMVCKRFQYTAYLDEADAIIDFCKLKSHGMMGMSNAAKNMFGVIPGTMKPEYHFQFPNARDFARMIVDLDEYFKPVLSISDAVIGMEGNGPTAGTPRKIGAVLASRSPHKLDLVCAKIIGLEPDQVPTLEAALERGLIPKSVEALSIAGQLADFIVPDFQLVENRNSLEFRNLLPGVLGTWTSGAVKRLLSSVPKVNKQECVSCEKCHQICPAKAITMQNHLPHIDRTRCIRCFCCQEFCPKGAMKVHRPVIARLLNK